MKHCLLLLLFLAMPAFGQDLPTLTARSEGTSIEKIPELQLELPSEEEDNTFLTLLVEDIDDVIATIAISDELEFFAQTENVFQIDMVVDRYDEDQITDITPQAIDDIYPVDVSSRFISAGLRFTF